MYTHLSSRFERRHDRRIGVRIAALCSIAAVSAFSFAATPASALMYDPGQTLDPSCLPTDPNCGVNQVWYATSTAAYLNPSVPVGIGTTTPFAGLTLVGDSYVSGDSTVEGTMTLGTLTGVLMANNGQVSAVSTSSLASTLGITSSQWNTSGGNIYYTSGNIGIGTTSAPARLTVDGGSLVSGDAFFGGDITARNITSVSSQAQSMTAGYFTATSTTATSTFTNLRVNNALSLAGLVYDGNGSQGTNGYILQSTGTGVQWISTSTLGAIVGGSQFTTAGSNIYFNTGNLGLGTSTPSSVLTVQGLATVVGTSTQTTGLNLLGNTNNFFQLNVQNMNGGSSASSDIVATANNGNDSIHYVDLGINGSTGGSAPFTAPNHAYLYSVSDSLNIGALGSTSTIMFYTTGGTSSPAERMRITESGNVGIGTTTPTSALTIRANVGTTPLLVASSSGANLLTVALNGNVGVGVANPVQQLQVAGDIRVGTNGTNGCVENFAGISLLGLCLSDQNLKTDINSLSSVIDRYADLNVVTYKWNETAGKKFHNDTTIVNTGLIAQQLNEVFPELVDKPTEIGGYQRVNYSTLNIYNIKAIQELASRDILTTKALFGSSTPGLSVMNGASGATSEDIDAFNGSWFASAIRGWLGSAGNKLGEIFAGKINTRELCVGDDSTGRTCVTKAQLDQMLFKTQTGNQPASIVPSDLISPPADLPSNPEISSANTGPEDEAEENNTQSDAVDTQGADNASQQ